MSVSPTLMSIIESRVIDEFLKTSNISETEAMSFFYNSELYKLMENSDSGVWHFSSILLAKILLNEQKTGVLTFPEGV
jgi:hypothetical protein